MCPLSTRSGRFPPIAVISIADNLRGMIEPCAPDEAGLAFKGTEEALSSMLAYAEGIGATLLWRKDERVSVPFLLMRYRNAEEVGRAEQLHRAFTDGMFPDVEAFVLEPADESLRQKMRGF